MSASTPPLLIAWASSRTHPSGTSVAVSVFAHSVTELEAFEPGSGLTHVAWLTEEDLGQDVRTPEGVEILEAYGAAMPTHADCEFLLTSDRDFAGVETKR